MAHASRQIMTEPSLADEVRQEMVRQNLSQTVPDLEQRVRQIGRSWDIRGLFQRQAARLSSESAIVPFEPSQPDAEQAVVPVEPEKPASEQAVVPGLPDEKPQPAAFELQDKPLTTQHQAAMMARLHQAASQVVARNGMQGEWKPGPGRPRKAVTDSPKLKKAGRPPKGVGPASDEPLVPASFEPGPRQERSLQAASRKLRTDMSPTQKDALCRQLQVIFEETGSSRRKVFAYRAAQLGCTTAFVRRCWDARQVWAAKVLAEASRPTATQLRNRQSCKPEQKSGRKAQGASEAHKKRQAGKRGYLGTTDWLREERQSVRAWAEFEEQCGHSLGRRDIFRQFKNFVAAKEQMLLSAQAERGLTREEEKALSCAQGRLTAWKDNKKKDKAALKLLRQISFAERKTNRLTHLEPEEETRRLHCSWQLYDYLLWLTGKGSVEDLRNFVARPELFRINWKQTALLFTDQIPVWLKVDGDKQAVSTKTLGRQRVQQAARRDLRKQVKEGSQDPDASTVALSAASESYLRRGPGSTDAARYRITYCARQAIENYFDDSVQPEGDSIH